IRIKIDAAEAEADGDMIRQINRSAEITEDRWDIVPRNDGLRRGVEQTSGTGEAVRSERPVHRVQVESQRLIPIKVPSKVSDLDLLEDTRAGTQVDVVGDFGVRKAAEVKAKRRRC